MIILIWVSVLGLGVPNRYMPSALTAMVSEQHDELLRRQGKDGGDAHDRGAQGDSGDDEYIPEYEALVSMLKPEHQAEFRDRHEVDDDG